MQTQIQMQKKYTNELSAVDFTSDFAFEFDEKSFYDSRIIIKKIPNHSISHQRPNLQHRPTQERYMILRSTLHQPHQPKFSLLAIFV
jgi:hypothetical protein